MKLKILLVDDDKDYSQSLTDRVDEFEIVHIPNWEDGIAELKDNFYTYSGIILDGRGQLNRDSKTDDDSHVHKAIGDLKVLNSQGRYIPFVVNTAFFKPLKDSVNYDGIKIFDKSNQEEEMIKCLISLIATSDLQKLRHEYKIALDFAQNHFNEDNLALLIDTLTGKSGDEADFLWKREKLGNLRRLNEALMDSLALNMLPFMSIDEIIDKVNRERGNRRTNRGNRTIGFIEYFHNITSEKIPPPLYNDIKNIYHTASTYSVHNEPDEDYYPSHYTVRGLIQSHVGCYEWVQKRIDNQQQI